MDRQAWNQAKNRAGRPPFHDPRFSSRSESIAVLEYNVQIRPACGHRFFLDYWEVGPDTPHRSDESQ